LATLLAVAYSSCCRNKSRLPTIRPWPWWIVALPSRPSCCPTAVAHRLRPSRPSDNRSQMGGSFAPGSTQTKSLLPVAGGTTATASTTVTTVTTATSAASRHHHHPGICCRGT
jgi:hypothetical protein